MTRQLSVYRDRDCQCRFRLNGWIKGDTPLLAFAGADCDKGDSVLSPARMASHTHTDIHSRIIRTCEGEEKGYVEAAAVTRIKGLFLFSEKASWMTLCVSIADHGMQGEEACRAA